MWSVTKQILRGRAFQAEQKARINAVRGVHDWAIEWCG